MTHFARRNPSVLVAWLVVAGCFVVVLAALYHGVLVPPDRVRSGMIMIAIMPAYVCAARRLSRYKENH
ncbi:MAG TPA: hypothetical protein VFV38_19265 [Ktedonobacteraceae bacterium]|nr:hypothetical protein [Ktedonobacteraceae bacterium]